jgi:hypothetical protein
MLTSQEREQALFAVAATKPPLERATILEP